MSKNVRQDVANVIRVGFSTSASIPSGGGVLVGNIFGVVENDVAATTVAVDVEVRVRGVTKINKATSLAVAIGDALYWDDSGKVVNKTNTNKEVGWARTSTGAGTGESTVEVVMIPTIRAATNS